MIIQLTVFAAREQQTREEQAGFNPERDCVDQIFALHQLLELRYIYAWPAIVVNLDIRGAFDSIDGNRLFDRLVKFGMPEKIVAILKARYSGTIDQVRGYGQLSPSFG